MLRHLRKGRLALAFALLAAFCLGFAAPALAEDQMYDPADAKLTKVIVAPENTDASNDTYTFQFEGKGKVVEGNTSAGQNRDNLYSEDGIEQDSLTLAIGDEIPAIPDCTLTGINVTSSSALSADGLCQSVVQKSLAEILNGVIFEHAGVYTYRVTEKSAVTTLTDGTFVNKSGAAYTLRLYVTNTVRDNSVTTTQVSKVTVEKTTNDNGDLITGAKVDPTYPIDNPVDGKIDQTAQGETPIGIAGDGRGRDVDGLTFANEYLKGGSLVVKKLMKGDYADKTKKFHVKLEVIDPVAMTPDAQGCVATYVITNGDDATNNTLADGSRPTLTGVFNVEQKDHTMVTFDKDTGIATIEAYLYEGGTIQVTGVYGPFNNDWNDPDHPGDKRMTIWSGGPKVDTMFRVSETDLGDYTPSIYVFNGAGDGTDLDSHNAGEDLTSGAAVYVKGSQGQDISIGTADSDDTDNKVVVGGNGTIAYVVNELKDNQVSPTGILINNLPYILMVAVPVGVFAVMFVARRRRNAAA